MKLTENKPLRTIGKVIQNIKVEGKDTFYKIEFERKKKK